jgi:transposase
VRPQTEEGVPLARWSYAEIAARLVTLGLVVSVATSSVARWLSVEKLKPWRYRLWQHIEEPEAFLERARPVLWLYRHAKTLFERGIWLVCVDEKTSIQARKRQQAPRPPTKGGQTVLLSPRYDRKGALHLFAGLSVVDGQVYGLCQARKRFVDFQHFLLTVIIPAALDRQVKILALILDNGTTHAPKQLDAWLQQQITQQQWPLSIQIYWLPKNASWLDQIEIWFSILQRKLLTPNHFDTLQALQTAIELFIAFHNRSAKPINWSYTVEKLEHKLGIN